METLEILVRLDLQATVDPSTPHRVNQVLSEQGRNLSRVKLVARTLLSILRTTPTTVCHLGWYRLSRCATFPASIMVRRVRTTATQGAAFNQPAEGDVRRSVLLTNRAETRCRTCHEYTLLHPKWTERFATYYLASVTGRIKYGTCSRSSWDGLLGDCRVGCLLDGPGSLLRHPSRRQISKALQDDAQMVEGQGNSWVVGAI
jgi:hypothetical protein